MHVRPALVLACLFLGTLGSAHHAAAEPGATYDEACAVLTQEFLTELESLGAWCNQSHLFAARNEVARWMLELDPDAKRAREWLKFRRAKDGAWEQRQPYKEPSDSKPEHRPAFETRRAGLLAAIRPRAIAMIRDARPALDERQRLEAVAHWRTFLGDDPELLKLAGMVEFEGGWRDAGTVRSIRRIVAIQEAAKAARAHTPPIEPTDLGETERAISLPWVTGRRTAKVTVHGTASASFHDSVARIVHATESFAGTMLGGTFTLPPGFTLYIMKGEGAFERMVDEHPSVHGDRKTLRTVSGCWLAYNTFVDRMESPAGSLDSAIGVTMQVLLAQRFSAGDGRWMPGWVADGFSLYAMTHLTGTHLSFTVDLGRYGQDPLFKSLFSSATDWMAEARNLMLASDPKTLRLALGLKIGRLSPRDFLASYAFVAWLVEVRRAEETDALLRALAGGQSVDEAFQAGLGMSVEDAEDALKRWLQDTAK